MTEETKSRDIEIIQAVEANRSEEDTAVRGVIFEVLRNGKIVYISTGLKNLTGHEIQKVLGSDINDFLERLLGHDSAKELWPYIGEVLRGTRQFLESNARAENPLTGEKKLYAVQFESASEDFNRAVLFLQDISLEQEENYHLDNIQLRSMRILEKGNLIFLRSDTELKITEILGDTHQIFGIRPSELEKNPNLWLELLIEEDYRSLNRALYRLIKKPKGFTKEVRFHHYQSKQIKWMLFSAVPLKQDGQLVGWEGFGLDITDKKASELELKKQTKRYNALYQVATNIQDSHNPNFTFLRGLSTLITATSADAGLVYYGSSLDQLEIAAIKGFSSELIESLESYSRLDGNIVSSACNNSYGLILQNLKQEAESYSLSFLETDFLSIMAVPLIVQTAAENKQVLGGILLASKKQNAFSQDDLDLAYAAADQIAIRSYQAEHTVAEKKQADSVNILYRLSRRLTSVTNPEQIADSAFPLIDQVCKTKRIWMGVMNDGASHLIGIKGQGPGMRSAINNVQIELSIRHDFLDQAISEKRPIIFNRNDHPECSKLQKLLDRLDPSCLLIIPMMSIGQVLGVLVIEPTAIAKHSLNHHLPLLSSVANEMAAAILSRKFEVQVAKADKMRMAGLLVSGVAHNFNNLLQAVIGQASLIEAGLEKKSPLKDSTKSIIESATKGAELIKKMMFMSDSAMPNPTVLDLVRLVKESEQNFKELVGDIEVKLEIVPETSEVVGDYFNLQQVISSIVANAKDAIDKKKDATREITIQIENKDLLTSDISPNLSPGKYVEIKIHDDGIGMDETQVERCFEPFYTTKDFDENTGVGYTGSGLSLARAYTIMQNHGGLIIVDSKLNQGSTFSIYVPLHSKSKKSEFSSEFAKQRVAIVIADQGSVPKKSIKVLKDLKFKILQLSKRSEILTYFALPDFEPELLLVDLDYASSDIIDFLKLLKEQYAKLHIICFSNEQQKWSNLLRFIEDVSFIAKPFKLVDFHQELKTVFSTEKVVPLLDNIKNTKDE